jgi:lipoprotein-releasing system permease protein
MISLKIALRFLRSSRGQTILIIAGIAVGVAVQVFVGSLIGSLQTSLVDSTVGRSSQVTVVPADNSPTIQGWDGMVTKIRDVGGVTTVSVAADSAAFIDKSGRTASVVVRGFNFEDANGIYRLDEAIYEGSWPQTSMGVLVGRELRNDLNLGLLGTFDVITANASRFTVTITGFYDLKVASINRAWVLTDLSTAQGIFGFGSNVTSIEIQGRGGD